MISTVALDRMAARRAHASLPLLVRLGLVVAIASVFVVVQFSVLPVLLPAGFVPNLALLVVVAAGVTRGREFGSLVGFGLGVVLDLGPMSTHLAGRWALALLLTGYLVGSVHDAGWTSAPTWATRRTRVVELWLSGFAGAFVGTSVFVLSGLALGDARAPGDDIVSLVARATLVDGTAGLIAIPIGWWCLVRTRPAVA
ncbi:MAG: rod shape-determining protein MreD [Nocardioides sp.]